eukprot:TRINITY_DN4108_c0_g1_i2.p1 TRINITY_DN4108_c0_g1~~TRINITY_DN4108_c0_g1_i2.p1  ORF type:complete len:158 (+),score=20.67 TRINITY_DN4108_c0_g1_i2:254-727(+)
MNAELPVPSTPPRRIQVAVQFTPSPAASPISQTTSLAGASPSRISTFQSPSRSTLPSPSLIQKTAVSPSSSKTNPVVSPTSPSYQKQRTPSLSSLTPKTQKSSTEKTRSKSFSFDFEKEDEEHQNVFICLHSRLTTLKLAKAYHKKQGSFSVMSLIV